MGKVIPVREMLKMPRKDGWNKVSQDGSHVQMKHPTKKGKVTVPGHKGEDLCKGTANSILRQAGLKELD